MNVSQEVRDGARALDEITPGWYHSIDLLLLDMSSPYLCVLGQLAIRESPDDTGATYNSWRARHGKGIGWAYEHGFLFSRYATITEADETMQRLTTEWKSLIRERLGQSTPPTAFLSTTPKEKKNDEPV